MSKFFVSPSTETALFKRRRGFPANGSSSRFGNVHFEDIREGNRLLTWEFTGTHGSMDGYLNRKRQVVVLDGDVRDCAEFAQWYRSIVDSQYELIFYDDSYNSVPITETQLLLT